LVDALMELCLIHATGVSNLELSRNSIAKIFGKKEPKWQIVVSEKAFALALAWLQGERSHASGQRRDEKLHRGMSTLLSNVLIDGDGAVFGGWRWTYRGQALQLDDGLRRDLPDIRSFHVDRIGTSQTHLSLVRRNLWSMRRRLWANRWNERMRGHVPTLRRELQENGCLNSEKISGHWHVNLV
jgi:hypothetical protein